MLTYESIPVVAQKLRSENGLKIIMDTGTGEVLVRNIRRLDKGNHS
jgi:chemotaxis receptor (MCP) glutamine deamidase CheD